MKKFIKIVLIVVPVLIVAVLLVLFFSLNSIVRVSVETIGPKVTGTAVRLDYVRISPFSGNGSLKGLYVGNPEGYKTDSAFELGEVRVDIDVKSLMSDIVTIREISINGPKITFEGKLSGSNIGKIRENVEEFSASVGPGVCLVARGNKERR